jgi:hypothetical protein
LNPVHIFTSYFFKIHFNIILPSTQDIPSGAVRLVLPTKICMRATWPTSPIHPTNVSYAAVV